MMANANLNFLNSMRFRIGFQAMSFNPYESPNAIPEHSQTVACKPLTPRGKVVRFLELTQGYLLILLIRLFDCR